jgi:hypothetical protein
MQGERKFWVLLQSCPWFAAAEEGGGGWMVTSVSASLPITLARSLFLLVACQHGTPCCGS